MTPARKPAARSSIGAIRSKAAMLIASAVMSMAIFPAHAGSYEDFFIAVGRDYAPAVRDLIQRGFDPNAADPKGQLGIIMALQDGELKAADAIASSPGFKVDARNASGETALMMAALTGRLEWVKRLLKQGASVHQEGWSPIHYAAAGPEPEVIAYLLDKGAPLNAPSPNGTTPLMMASQYGAIDGATLLLQRGADPTLRNSQGWTATDFAQRADRDRLARAIDAAVAKAENKAESKQ
ncbi:ankyrin repeat domain-containing protein [soil metagenome]